MPKNPTQSLSTENRSISCLAGGILQESADDGDVGQEVAVAVAIVVGPGVPTPSVGVKKVPDDGNVVGVEQIAGAAAAAAGSVVVAAEEASHDRDAGEIEATTAATGTVDHLWLL